MPKIYLGYVHRYAYDPVYRPYYEFAGKYKVPVVFHTGDTASKRAKLKYADPLTVDEVAVDYPNTTFVIAHCGNPWIESAAEVAYKNDNVYLECSALLTGDLSSMRPRQVETVRRAPDRLGVRIYREPGETDVRDGLAADGGQAVHRRL